MPIHTTMLVLQAPVEVGADKNSSELKNEGNELSFSKKLAKLGEFVPAVRKDVEAMKVVK